MGTKAQPEQDSLQRGRNTKPPIKGKKQNKKSQTMAAVSHFIVWSAKKQSLFYDFFLLCSKKLSKEATTAQIWTKQSRPHVCDTARSWQTHSFTRCFCWHKKNQNHHVQWNPRPSSKLGYLVHENIFIQVMQPIYCLPAPYQISSQGEGFLHVCFNMNNTNKQTQTKKHYKDREKTAY